MIACRGCGAQIVWVETKHGKRQPIDPKPEKRLVVDWRQDPPRARVVDTYTPHHATCPVADQFRRSA